MTNKLILGTVQFGLPYGINNAAGQVTKEQSFAILNHAWANGITCLDTAAGYGESEAVIGKYMAKNPDKDFSIITKFSSKANCEASLLESLDKLNAKKIYSVLFHSFPHYKESMNEIDNLARTYKGIKFDTLGVSVYTNDELEQLGNDERVDIIQLPFNLLDNDRQRGEILKTLKAKGKTIHTRSAFLQGLFFMDTEKIPEKLSALKQPLQLIKRLCASHNLNIGHLSLQYALQKEYIDGVLIGVDSVAQLQQNIEWSGKAIHNDVFDAIDMILIENTDLLNPAKW